MTLGGCFIASFILEFNRDLDKKRESAASNIAKKKQEAEASVSIWLAYTFKSALHEGFSIKWADLGVVGEGAEMGGAKTPSLNEI